MRQVSYNHFGIPDVLLWGSSGRGAIILRCIEIVESMNINYKHTYSISICVTVNMNFG